MLPSSPFPSPMPNVPPTLTPTANPTPGCINEDVKVLRATGNTCEYYAEQGHCQGVFCPTCPYNHFCDKSCGFCLDEDGNFRPPE